jgi:hypothetical protein
MSARGRRISVLDVGEHHAVDATSVRLAMLSELLLDQLGQGNLAQPDPGLRVRLGRDVSMASA